MKPTLSILALGVLVGSAFLTLPSPAVSQSTPSPTTWTYQRGRNLTERELNDFGKQGWELVAVTALKDENSSKPDFDFFLKHPW